MDVNHGAHIARLQAVVENVLRQHEAVMLSRSMRAFRPMHARMDCECGIRLEP